MKLDVMQHCQNKGLPSEWRIEGCDLGNINLIVGKNASGKSKILKAINLIAGLLSGEVNINENNKFDLIEWTLFFDSHSDKDKKIYTLKVMGGCVIQEKFVIGDKTYLDRQESGEGKVWANKLELDIDFQTPIDEVAALKRRDSIQHPFFEGIYTWANSLRYYQFGTDLGRSSIIITKNIDTIKKNINFKDADEVIGVFKLGEEELGDTFIQAIKSDMERVGYQISQIGTKTSSLRFPTEFEIQPQCLYVQEIDLKGSTEQVFMSQGMFRALSLIIQINYSLLAGKPSCILIDDIGEGLDFERSSAMIQVLIDKASSGLVQLIMTTNDRFIMNGVPLEYWSVIERQAGLAKLHNIHNSKQVFDDFKFTGLNNFDFFSTQFYVEGFGEQELVNQ
jgi:energy-coupling factor transporter ATP-binding protein EcfA2